MSPQTLAEKVWERHVVHRADGEPDLLYVDLHLVHEVTSPQAFDGLRVARPPRPPARPHRRDHGPQRPDHPGPGHRHDQRPADGSPRRPTRRTFDVTLYPDGLARPGHRARDRSRAGLHAAGAGHRLRRLPHLDARRVRRARVRHRHQSEVEHVLATQTLPQNRPGTMAVTVDGDLPAGAARRT